MLFGVNFISCCLLVSYLRLDKINNDLKGSSEESVTILDNLVKPRFLGRNQRYKLIVKENKLIFLRMNRRWFFKKGIEISNQELANMSPLAIKRLSLGSYMLDGNMVSAVEVKESIPFVLMLDPKEAANFNLTGLEDDIVREVPLVLRRDKVKGMDVVEREWSLCFEAPRAVISFIVPYDPLTLLPEFLRLKVK